MVNTGSRTLVVTLLAAAMPAGLLCGADWPNWRGPERTGASPERQLPLRWGVTENVAWTLPLPSGGGSTSIVIGDRVFLNVADGGQVFLWCVDRRDGSVTWKRPVGSSRKTPRATSCSCSKTRSPSLTGATGMRSSDARSMMSAVVWRRVQPSTRWVDERLLYRAFQPVEFLEL